MWFTFQGHCTIETKDGEGQFVPDYVRGFHHLNHVVGFEHQTAEGGPVNPSG
jgi:hypothetical protein